jgi:tRNA dimethylallyltransferase
MPYMPQNSKKPKLFAIVGPTSSGKSELAVKLAKKLDGEIISADSRQIYKGMDLGTGKIPGKWFMFPFSPSGGEAPSDGAERVQLTERQGGQTNDKKRYFVYKSVIHHLIDFASPRSQFSVAKFKVLAQKAIKDILSRGKIPILCGGTAHWIDAVIFDQNIPDVKPNKKLRAELEKKSADELFKQLKKLDSARAKNIDRFNKRRLIRALEIVISTGKPVPSAGVILRSASVEGSQTERDSSPSDAFGLRMTPYRVVWVGINPPQDILNKKIKLRLKKRFKQGMIKEVKKLRRNGLSWKKLESFGLEYKFISLYLQKKLTFNEMFSQLSLAIKHYSKRQMTWWKKNRDILWLADYHQISQIKKLL